MNWIFPLSKGSGPLPPLTTLQQQRQRQIESLRVAHSNIAEIQKDVEYRLPFTVNNTTININILLPPQFPQEKPVVSVFPPVRHHLVDQHNGTVVTSPLLTNFTMHSDLGKIIQSILDEFWKSPLVLVPSSTSFPYLYSNPAGIAPYTQGYSFLPPYPPQDVTRPVAPTPVSVSDSVLPPASTFSRPAAPIYGFITDLPLPVPTVENVFQVGLNGHSYRMPDIPETFSELSERSISQLKDLNDQDNLLLEQLVDLPQLKQVMTDRDDLVKSIEKLAKMNLLLEPKLEAQRQDLLEKYEHLNDTKTAFEKKMQRQHELSESCSLSTMQARLKVAAHQAEEESDTIADEFLEGKVEIDDFLSSFMEKRTLCHCRRAKEEKLQQTITHEQFHAP
ncbi:vacuolar protein sorting-associated protein 37A isoform X1 [Latimeria chalumnae]|uniref:vacuolar protein sorting-associated protein 37A isoform X1 n=1 Tax=Latimeria chalumnae TaxID=7897 RepID=UPI00313AB8FD